jgi:hypothetical protein
LEYNSHHICMCYNWVVAGNCWKGEIFFLMFDRDWDTTHVVYNSIEQDN